MRKLILTLALLLLIPTPALAQEDPCVQWSCLYGHHRGYSRDGSQHIEFGIAQERLPDGPDGRFFIEVLYPMISDSFRYQTARRPMWDQAAACESTNNWAIETGNGFSGGLQFTIQTWNAYGGGEFAARPSQAPPEQQIAVAERVLWAGHEPYGPQGRWAWPHCGRHLQAPG